MFETTVIKVKFNSRFFFKVRKFCVLKICAEAKNNIIPEIPDASTVFISLYKTYKHPKTVLELDIFDLGIMRTL